MTDFTCDIVTPESKLFSDEAYMVVVPGVQGSMGFLPGHAPVVSALSDGIVKVSKDSDSSPQVFACQGGYVEVSDDKVIILADRAKEAIDIDAANAKDMLENLESKASSMTDEELSKSTINTDIAWYKACLSAIQEK